MLLQPRCGFLTFPFALLKQKSVQLTSAESSSITLKNNTKQNQSFSSMMESPQLVLKDGTVVESDIATGMMFLSSKPADGAIPAGLKKNTEFLFEVPKSAKNMRFYIDFFNKTPVFFDLK